MKVAHLSEYQEDQVTFRDGLGVRVRAVSEAGEPVERFILHADFTPVQHAVHERVTRLTNLTHVKFPRLRGFEKGTNGNAPVIITSAFEGRRLSDVLLLASHGLVTFDLGPALQVTREVLAGLMVLHDSRTVTHGSLAPERVVLTPHGRVVIVDHVLSQALDKLQLPRHQLWRDWRIATPPAAGPGRFDARTDLAQAGLLVLALLLGRAIDEEEYPHRLRSLLPVVLERLARRTTSRVARELHAWLERLLPVDTRHPFASVKEAQLAFEALVSSPGASLGMSPAQVKSLLDRCIALDSAPAQPGEVCDVPSSSFVAVPLLTGVDPIAPSQDVAALPEPGMDEVDIEELLRLAAELDEASDGHPVVSEWQPDADSALPAAEAAVLPDSVEVTTLHPPGHVEVAAEDAWTIEPVCLLPTHVGPRLELVADIEQVDPTAEDVLAVEQEIDLAGLAAQRVELQQRFADLLAQVAPPQEPFVPPLVHDAVRWTFEPAPASPDNMASDLAWAPSPADAGQTASLEVPDAVPDASEADDPMGGSPTVLDGVHAAGALAPDLAVESWDAAAAAVDDRETELARAAEPAAECTPGEPLPHGPEVADVVTEAPCQVSVVEAELEVVTEVAPEPEAVPLVHLEPTVGPTPSEPVAADMVEDDVVVSEPFAAEVFAAEVLNAEVLEGEGLKAELLAAEVFETDVFESGAVAVDAVTTAVDGMDAASEAEPATETRVPADEPLDAATPGSLPVVALGAESGDQACLAPLDDEVLSASEPFVSVDPASIVSGPLEVDGAGADGDTAEADGDTTEAAGLTPQAGPEPLVDEYIGPAASLAAKFDAVEAEPTARPARWLAEPSFVPDASTAIDAVAAPPAECTGEKGADSSRSRRRRARKKARQKVAAPIPPPAPRSWNSPPAETKSDGHERTVSLVERDVPSWHPPADLGLLRSIAEHVPLDSAPAPEVSPTPPPLLPPPAAIVPVAPVPDTHVTRPFSHHPAPLVTVVGDLPPVPSATPAVARQRTVVVFTQQINWRRTVAAAVMLALLESAAFAAAWWWVQPGARGTLVVQTSVPGVEVLIDGKSVGHTPYHDDLPPGRHALTLRRGALQRQMPVEISLGVVTTQTLSWPAASAGGLRVTSAPEGADVVIGGRVRGQTPLTVDDLSAGRHTLVLRSRSGTVSVTAVVVAGETTSIDVPIFAGWVRVHAPVDLAVAINGTHVGSSLDGQILLSPGTHRVAVSSDTLGFAETLTATVEPGRVRNLTVTLPEVAVEAPGENGAEVFVDGVSRGVLPEAATVPLGTHEIVLRRADGSERRRTLTVRAGAPVTFD